ncbi:Phosphoglucan phosphatase lsf1 protein [Thalictrum thalictroides]|uniref:Phosphoglucan phosphatase lsf1 protein n=1 Tax=Thalictrum thalictroides TaxID=46969 RepID=A0A7J6UWU9_THATH|nr:Phosphoglucan phosphatase lsf1 protein [Thalictrum thalictroides]
MSKPAPFNMNLNEYMVTLQKPLGIRFASSVDGKIFVHALKKGGNAEKSRIIMVGDTVKKASIGHDGGFVAIKDFGDAQKLLEGAEGQLSLVLERPYSPFPIQQFSAMSDLDILFNRGRVPIVTWNRNVLASNLQTSPESSGNSGFAMFSPKSFTSQGWKYLSDQNGSIHFQTNNNTPTPSISQLVSIFSDDGSEDAEWAHGSFRLEEYIKALDRAKGELIYNHSRGMQYNKITEQIYVGSCIQTEADVETLANVLGITAILNFQSPSECSNWGIDLKSINDSCQRSDILMINYPIREVDSYDLRKKLPFCAGLLLRLLRKNFRVFVTCTSGFDRSPACVISYLHWMQDTSLNDACNFVTALHQCRPNRPAIVWATWDLIAMMEKGKHDGPPTHAVTFMWSGREGEDVYLVGDFTGNWKEPVKAIHKGGSRFEADIKLSHGRYCYKYIINGNWRHSTSSPTVTDEHGNVNNVIVVGDVASVRPSFQQPEKDSAVVKVIERRLTEVERVMLAKAARCVTFSICPIRLAPK